MADRRADRPGLRQGGAILGLALVVALGLGVRMLDAPVVFTPEGIRAAGPDAYYHLRRVAFGYEHFPKVLERDPYLNHPHGGDVIWPPGLDWSVAAAARLALGPDAPAERLQRFALHVPVGMGIAALLGTFAFAAWRMGVGAALVASGLLALLPAHALYSRIGMLDHHAAEPLVTLGFLFAATFLLEGGGPRRSALSGSLPAVALAAVIAGSFWIWPGSLLQLALLDAGLALRLVAGPAGEATRRLAGQAALAHALAALALLPFAGRSYAHWGSFAPVVLGAFQPWLLGCGAVAHAALAWRARDEPLRRFASLFGIGILLLLASGAVWPELAAAPREIWGWLARDEAFQSQVSESLPLFNADPRGRATLALRLLSGAVLAFPIVWGIHAASLRRRFDAGGVALSILAVGLGLAAIAQRRFANAFSVPFVLLLGWLVAVWIPAALRAGRLRRPARAGVWCAVAVLGLAALLPSLDGLAPGLNRRAERRAGEPLRLAVDQWRRHELHRLAEWMAEHTPETAGYDPTAGAPRPGYGVLGHWSNGHIVVGVARRPAVVTNFGDDLGPENMVAMARYFQAPEPEASRILDALRVRYAILEFRKQVPLHEFAAGSMISRAFFADGERATAARERRGGEERDVVGRFPALARHRLVYEAAPKPWAPDQPFFKLYEHVAGAWLEGRAPAGSAVQASLGLETARGRRFAWRSEARSGPDGRYRLRIPYATVGAATAVRSDPSVVVRTTLAEHRVVVHERDVQEGRSVAVPAGAAPAAAGSPR